MTLETGSAINTLSLFSGAGGLDIGFHNAGFNILASVELETAYARTLEKNARSKRYFPGSVVHCQDIREFDPDQYAQSNIECVIGGPPCQTFSAAGRRSGGVLGTSDARGRLFESYCRILSVLDPKVFVFENVYGLPGANGGGPWREICSAFSDLGYDLRAEVVDSADYGVPQHRERLIIVGYKDCPSGFTFPAPTHGPDSRFGNPLISASEALKGLPKVENTEELGGLYGHLLPLVPPGLNYAFFTREMGYPKPYFAWRSKFHDFLHKCDPSNPARTIKAQPGKFTGPFHWDNRHFTAAELKRLQSFPDDYEIVGSFAKVVEQVGNSVPPRLAEVIATSVREQVLRTTDKLTFPIREAGFQSTFRQRQRERTLHFKDVARAAVADRFPNVHLIEERSAQAGVENYLIEYETNFRRRVVESSEGGLGFGYLRIEERREKDRLEILISPNATGRFKTLNVEITGLAKYLIDLDVVSVIGRFKEPSDIFRIWGAIETVIIRRSQFFSLIDIYGHYANRGDTVCINTSLAARAKSSLARAIEFFGNSQNSGKFITKADFALAAGIELYLVDSLILELRAMRMDVRSALTHPTISGSDIICTYPFPLLSSKAQLERRINE